MGRIVAVGQSWGLRAAVGLTCLAPPIAAVAQTYTTLHSFSNGADGSPSGPDGKLLLDAHGTILDTSYRGGVHNQGTVYQLSPAGIVTVLHSFTPPDEEPTGGVIEDTAGNLYGTTRGGGGSAGSVFVLPPNGHEESIKFNAASGPLNPASGLAFDRLGNAAGTTQAGGAYGDGTVFKVAPNGTLTLTHAFAGAPDGREPSPEALAADPHGNLYGATYYGGTSDAGAIYEIAPSGTAVILYSFGLGITIPEVPNAGLVRDAAGNLYGTTIYGGANDTGCIFKLAPDGSFTTLYSFTPDVFTPNGNLARDQAGNLYGTTQYGGTSFYGEVYRLSPGGVFTILHSFGSIPDDGLSPSDGVTLDAAGNLYGTAGFGPQSGGTVWEISP